MWIQSVVLEDHRYVAVLGCNIVNDSVADANRAGRNVLQPGDHPEERALAATRRTHEDYELAILDVQRGVLHRYITVRIDLLYVVEPYS